MTNAFASHHYILCHVSLIPRLSETSTVGLGMRLVSCMQGGGPLRSIIVTLNDPVT